MKVKITLVRIVDVSFRPEDPDLPEEAEVDIESFRDSYNDDILNAQEVAHETDDGKFSYVPGVTLRLQIEEVDTEDK